MKYIVLFLMVPFFGNDNCCKHKTTAPVIKETSEEPATSKISGIDSLPSCLRIIINETAKNSPIDLPLQIDEYAYNEKKVYFFTAPCCDNFNMLYDDKCAIICAPSGGITGRGDGNCTDFDQKAKHIKLLWKNSSK